MTRCLLLCLLVGWLGLAAPAGAADKPRLFVLTDIENEPDDAQSLVRLLTYANQFDIEGLVATTSIHQRHKTAAWRIREIVAAYGQVQANLLLHEPGYPSAEQLLLNGPGVLWVAALLATLLALNSLFVSDYEDGSLEQLILSPQPLPLLVFGKALAHWLVTGVPLVLLSPVLAVTFRLPATVTGLLVLTLILGTLSLSMLGSIGAAFTVGLNRGNALLSLLILPLAMPVLIFGARTVSLA